GVRPDRSLFSISAGYSPDGRWIAGACSDGYYHLWDAYNARELCRFGSEPEQLASAVPTIGNANCFAFSPDGKTLATAGKDGSVRLFEIFSGGLRQRLTGHAAAVYALAFSPDGRRLYTAGADTTVLVWDLHRFGETAAAPLSAEDRARLWDDLGSTD